MDVESYMIIPFVAVCHYGETKYVFLIIGGLLLPNETLVAGALRHYGHLAWFHLAKH